MLEENGTPYSFIIIIALNKKNFTIIFYYEIYKEYLYFKINLYM